MDWSDKKKPYNKWNEWYTGVDEQTFTEKIHKTQVGLLNQT